jgi:hypothetical protein
MALKLRTTQEKYCIPYKDDQGKELAKFYCVVSTPSETKKILDSHRIIEWDAPDDKAKKERLESYDFLAVTQDRIDKMIVGWEGVENEKGESLPCNRENKLILFELNPHVINYVRDRMNEIEEEIKGQKGEERKNS